jgi:hypothetical protein
MPKLPTPTRKIGNFNISPADAEYIRDIAQKAVQFGQELGKHYDVGIVERDLTACHLNIMPLDLNGMLMRASALQMYQDVIGIHTHIDRIQLLLKSNFEPRWRARG